MRVCRLVSVLLPASFRKPFPTAFPVAFPAGNRFPAGKAVGNRFPARGAVGEGSLEIGTLAVAVILGSRFFEGEAVGVLRLAPSRGKSVSRGESDSGKVVGDLWVRGTGLGNRFPAGKAIRGRRFRKAFPRGNRFPAGKAISGKAIPGK